VINWPNKQPILVAGDLLLRPWKTEDAEAVYKICQDSEIAEFQTLNSPFSYEDAKNFVTGNDESFYNQSSMAYAGEVNGQVVLSIVLHSVNKFDHVIEIGYWVSPTSRGQGLGTQAVRMLTNQAFEMGFRRVQAICDELNQGSISVLKKSGYILEARLERALTRRSGEQTQALLFATFPN
jgi:RimJ/RimL family protein N-acetyltransferase